MIRIGRGSGEWHEGHMAAGYWLLMLSVNVSVSGGPEGWFVL